MKIILPILILNLLILSPIFFINAQTQTPSNSQSEILKLIETELQSLTEKVVGLQKKVSYFIIEKEIAGVQIKITELQEKVFQLVGKTEAEEETATTTEEIATTTEEVTATTTEEVATTTEEVATTTEEVATTTEEEAPVTGGGAGGVPTPEPEPEPEPEADTTAPAAITNLTASNPTVSSIDLSWTAPGDDGSSGTATSYDVRYSTASITDTNWGSATQVTGELTPTPAGSSQSMTVSGLSYGTTYYFTIKTSDEVPNESGLSNVASLTTNAPEECTRPVASGKRTYNVRTKDEPHIGPIDIDPLDVNLGAVQIVTAKIRDTNDNPITEVSGTGYTDSSSVPFSLSLIDGSETDGTWEGSWSPQDIFCNNYQVGITATSASGQSSVVLTFR